MRGARASMNLLLRSVVRNSASACDGGAKGGGSDLVGSLLRTAAVEDGIWSSRRFASDASDKGSVPKEPSSAEEPQETKTEVGRWWQRFSQQNKLQAGNSRKPRDLQGKEKEKESGAIESDILKDKNLSGQVKRDSKGKESLRSSWLFPDVNKKTGEEPETPEKEIISRLFQPKDTKDSSSEREQQEITSNEVGARWLASSKEKSSTEQELADVSSVPWMFGLSKETPALERERLEVSMQRLALMTKDSNQSANYAFLPPKNELLRKYFHWENKASPVKHKVTLTKVRQDFQIHKTDCGSSQVQIALLTTKIKYMTEHMQTHRKDYHSRKGLEAMVQRRRKILKYLRRKDWDAYCDVITKLGLRDNVLDVQKPKHKAETQKQKPKSKRKA